MLRKSPLSPPLQINKLELPRLRNEEHFQYMEDISSLINEAGADTLQISEIFTLFGDFLYQEQQALERLYKSSLTASIAEIDTRRDEAFRGLNLQVESYSLWPATDYQQAAANMQVVLDKYGDVRKLPYNEETAAISNLLAELASRCPSEIDLLSLNGWVTVLTDANNTFNAVMDERYDEEAQEEAPSPSEARPETDDVYHRLVATINGLVLARGPEPYVTVVQQINARISYFKDTLAVRQGRSQAEKAKKVPTTL